VFDRLFL
jgi:hypothetical protein